MKIANLLNDLSEKLSPAARAELRDIVKIPEFEAIRDREENRDIERRLALNSRMKKIPGECKAAIAQAQKRCMAADVRIESLHNETMMARKEHVAATAVFLAAELAPQVALLEIEKELRSTADGRLGDYIWFLDEIDGRVRNA